MCHQLTGELREVPAPPGKPMAFILFLLLLVLGTGEGLGSAAAGARGSRAGSRAGGEVPGQGEWGGIPFKVGTRSQWHPGSRDFVTSPILSRGCSDPGPVVPSKAVPGGSECSPSAVSKGLGQGLGCAGTSRSRLCPGLAGWNAGVSR